MARGGAAAQWARCAALLAASLVCAAFGSSAAADGEPAASSQVSDTSSEARRDSLTANAIARVVRRHAGELRRCYEVALTRRPSLAGIVRIFWVIAPNGQVISSRIVDSTLGDEEVEQCLVAVTYLMTFPTSPTPTRVTFPFHFGRRRES